jgi:hypothetical protein
MDDLERKAQWKQDTDLLYRVIGEFVVTFELACHAIQICIVSLLNSAGLTNQRVTQIVLAGLTAEPLRTLFESLVGELVQLSESERKIIKDTVNRFQKLAQTRNDIVHSTWFIGYGNGSETDFSEASGHKFHKDKSGAVIKSFQRKAGDFTALTSEAQGLADIFQRLNGCFVMGRSVEKNFVVSEHGHVSVPTYTAS